jgi:hypothetical protein
MKGVCLNCTLKRSPENPGVVSESVTDGDEWPQVRERILAAENEATPIAFNRVAGVVVVGNEDGAHHCISEISGGGLARPAGQSDPGTTAELKEH